MRTKKEGYNTFSNYNAIRIYIDYVKRGRSANSVQLTWGGYAHFDEHTIKNAIGNYNIFIKRFFSAHIEDGYYKKNFIYVNEIPENIYQTYKGLWFPKVFLFLEETYEKDFLLDYLKTLFKPLSDYHHYHKSIQFSHYQARNGTENNTSISRFIGE